MATLADILSPVWTLSLNGGGAIAEGVAAIRQCIDIIVRTTKGTDPLRPLFGSDVYLYQDSPLNIAIPNTKAAIIDAIAKWESRVTITSISHTLGLPGNVIYNLNYSLVDKTLSDSIAFQIGSGGIVNNTGPRRLTLQGLFPPNPSSYQYQIYLVLDNNDVLPAPPSNGFTTIDDLYAWVQNNWLNYGQWYLTGAAIVGYIIPGYTQGQISVGLLAGNKVKTFIPGLPLGASYSVVVTVGDSSYSTSGLLSPSQILEWAQEDATLGALGDWEIETADDSFSEDFNDDFDTYRAYLSIYTQTAAITITITTA